METPWWAFILGSSVIVAVLELLTSRFARSTRVSSLSTWIEEIQSIDQLDDMSDAGGESSGLAKAAAVAARGELIREISFRVVPKSAFSTFGYVLVGLLGGLLAIGMGTSGGRWNLALGIIFGILSLFLILIAIWEPEMRTRARKTVASAINDYSVTGSSQNSYNLSKWYKEALRADQFESVNEILKQLNQNTPSERLASPKRSIAGSSSADAVEKCDVPRA